MASVIEGGPDFLYVLEARFPASSQEDATRMYKALTALYDPNYRPAKGPPTVAVKCAETGEQWPSVKAAAEALKVTSAAVSQAIARPESRKVKGRHLEYVGLPKLRTL